MTSSVVNGCFSSRPAPNPRPAAVQQPRPSTVRFEDNTGSTKKEQPVIVTSTHPQKVTIVEVSETKQVLDILQPLNDQVSLDHTSWFKAAWEKTFRFLFVITLLAVAACISVAISHLAQESAAKYIVAWSVAAFFVGIAVPIALHAIHMNILRYRNRLQRHYIRILWMIPIFSIESWLALRFSQQRIYLETMRQAYEAYVVYSFFSLLREFVGKDHATQVEKLKLLQTIKGRTHAEHLFLFFCCFKPYVPKWEFGEQFLLHTSIGVLQFVPVQIIFAGAILIAAHIRTDDPCYYVPTRRLSDETWHRRTASTVANTTEILNGTNNDYVELLCPNYYGNGQYRWDRLYLYQLIIVNISQAWAIYNMILFYHETEALTRVLRPLTKLVSVKGVVFVAFWQQCIITGAVYMDFITGYHLLSYNKEEVGDGLQNFLICIEMAAASVLMYRAFSYRDFDLAEVAKAIELRRLSVIQAVTDMVPRDIVVESFAHGRRLVGGHGAPVTSASPGIDVDVVVSVGR